MRLLVIAVCAAAALHAGIRLGLVGTDTSHVTAFAELFNDPANPNHVPGARIIAAYKGGSPDNEISRKYIDQYTNELGTKWGVEIVPDIATLCSKVDGVLLTSVDGRPHLAEARQIFAAKKPVWIDKPLAATLEDAREIARLAEQAGVPWWTSSSLRFAEMLEPLKGPGITGAMTWGPGPLEPHHQLDLSWYAIHPIEMLYTLMGPGCIEVQRVHTDGADEIVGRWKDGRIGSVRALRPYSTYGAVVFRGENVKQTDPNGGVNYRPMLVQIVKFFETRRAPVDQAETLEMFAFMDAALRSKQAGGAAMPLR